MPLMTLDRSTRRNRLGQILVLCRILAHYGVLDGDADAAIHQPRHRVQPRFFVGAEVALVLQVAHHGHAGGVREIPYPRLQAGGVAWIAAGQHHHQRKAAPAQQWRLVHGASEGWPGAGDGQQRIGQAGQPVQHLFVLGQRDVVEECVSAVDQPGDAGPRDVGHDAVVLRKIDTARRVVAPRQGRHGKDALGVLSAKRVSAHKGNSIAVGRPCPSHVGRTNVTHFAKWADPGPRGSPWTRSSFEIKRLQNLRAGQGAGSRRPGEVRGIRL